MKHLKDPHEMFHARLLTFSTCFVNAHEIFLKKFHER